VDVPHLEGQRGYGLSNQTIRWEVVTTLARASLAVLVVSVVLGPAGCSRMTEPGQAPADEPGDLVVEVDRALTAARGNRLSTGRHTPWEILHAALGLGLEEEVWDHEKQEPITFLRYFQRGGPYLSEPIFVVQGKDVQMRKSRHPSEVERHPDQFLAYFAQLELPLETRFEFQDRTFQLADMVATAKRRFDSSQETTFTLLALAAYSPVGEKWQNQYGRAFSVTDVAALEMARPAERLACGGTHSLFALGFALQKGHGNRQPTEPLWKSIADRLAEKRRLAQAAQEPDGSLPATLPGGEEGPGGPAGSVQAKIYMTGHMLEWIILTTPEGDLESPWIRRAVQFLCSAVFTCLFDPPSASPWYHALHALRMYRDRISVAREKHGPSSCPQKMSMTPNFGVPASFRTNSFSACRYLPKRS
jgi:hypothetical protein